MRLLNILILAFAATQFVFSQSDTIRKAVDTVKSGHAVIVLYDDHTWEDVTPPDVLAQLRADDSLQTRNYAMQHKQYRLDSTTFYDHWDTINIFAYGVPDFSRVNDTFAIRMLSDTGNFVMPVIGEVQSKFGPRWSNIHTGVDIHLNTGDTVVAALDGIVRYAGMNRGGYGNMVIIRHYNGLETYYAHMSKLLCVDNQAVKAGDVVGLGGRTGRAYGPHLHFEMRLRDNPFNPELIVDLSTHQLKADTLVLLPSDFRYIKSYFNRANFHIVHKGDTLWSLSHRYRVPVDAICKLNGIDKNSTLSIGQKIRLR